MKGWVEDQEEEVPLRQEYMCLPGPCSGRWCSETDAKQSKGCE